MKLRYSRSFQKQFQKLPSTRQHKVKEAVSVFEMEPTHQSLRNHPLKGDWQGYRSISAGGDLRLHYRTIKKDEVLFVAVGSHSQLYK